MTKLLKPAQVAERFDVHPNTVREWLMKGLLPSIKTPGGQYRIDPEAVERLLAAGAPDQPAEAVA